jgi:hypothetical protein
LKKSFIVLSALALLLTVGLYRPTVSSAATLPNKTTIGKVIRAVGEKMGIKWTASSLGAVAGYIAGKSSDYLLPSWELFGTVPDTLTPPGPDLLNDASLHEYLMSQADFNKNAKAIKDATNALKVGSTVPFYGVCQGDFQLPSNVSRAVGQGFMHYLYMGDDRITVYTPSTSARPSIDYTDQYNIKLVNILNYVNYKKDASTGSYSQVSSGSSSSMVIGAKVNFTLYQFTDTPDDFCTRTVTSSDTVNNQAIATSNVWNNIDNSVTTGYDTPTVPFIIKGADPTSDTTNVYNAPLTETEITNIYNPPVVVDPPPSPPADSSGQVDGDGHTLIGMVSDTYHGLVTFMDSSVTTLKSLMNGTAGLVSFLGTFFGWLPKQFVDVMTVSFMLGVIGFWFRR